MEGSLQYARWGVAVLSLDSRGTAESVMSPNAWKALIKMIDPLQRGLTSTKTEWCLRRKLGIVLVEYAGTPRAGALSRRARRI